MWWTHVQPHERPGTHSNESDTIKYPHFDYLHVSLLQMVQELRFDQVLTLYTCTDMWRIRVQPLERPGTHSNESGTIKYPHFDYLHVSLRQMVQELKLDQVLTLYNCTDTRRTRVQPRERPGTHPNESGTIKYPHLTIYMSLYVKQFKS